MTSKRKSTKSDEPAVTARTVGTLTEENTLTPLEQAAHNLWTNYTAAGMLPTPVRSINRDEAVPCIVVNLDPRRPKTVIPEESTGFEGFAVVVKINGIVRQPAP